MTFSWAFVLAVFLVLACPLDAVGASSEGALDAELDAHGHIRAQAHYETQPKPHTITGALPKESSRENPFAVAENAFWLDVIQKAKARVANTRKTSKMMRQEVRRHLPFDLERLAKGEDASEMAKRREKNLVKFISLVESGEVNCSAPSAAPDPASGKLCQILFGSNPQVAGKLERAVKGLSLRPRDENTTEMVVSDKEEDNLLSHLKAALWDLWFCAKRADPPCDPMDMKDAKVKAAREQAFDALHAIQSHAEEQSATGDAGHNSQTSGTQAASDAALGASTLPQAAAEAAAQVTIVPSPAGWTAAHPSRQDAFAPHQAIGPNGAALLQKAAHSQEPTPVANASEWAINTMNGLLTGPNVTGKLWDAINTMDIDDVLEQDIVKIENDEDGNMRKLKSNMLLLHECASMPDCPATNCCTPKNPTQAVYIQARNDAYKAYHNVQHDDDLAKQAYLDLLSTIGTGEKKTTTYYPPGHPLHKPTTTTIYPPGHPLHGTENQNNTNVTVKKKSAVAPPVEEGNTLLYAIIALTVVVVLAIGFLVMKTHEADKDAKGGESFGEGEWGGEGYGGGYGEESYGQY